MKKKQIILPFLAATALTISAPGNIYDAQASVNTYRVNVATGYLALRTEAALNTANEIGELYTGDLIEVTDYTGATGYWYVYSPKYDSYGYVNNDYLDAITSSGGARMQESALSLMQMAKTSCAVSKLDDEKLLYINLLTEPTFGGVTASFGMLGDIIVAEQGARIGFAGRRVIEQTIRQKLPSDFQTAEYLLKYGQVDVVSPRKELRDTLAKILEMHTTA